MDIAEVKHRLAEQETLVYQITHYMLQQEDLAVHAASRALLQLGQDAQFMRASLPSRRAMAIKTAMQCALRHAWPNVHKSLSAAGK